MTRKDLVDRLHEQAEGTLSRARISVLVDQLFEHISESLTDEGRFSLPGFGTFTVHVRSGRPGRNPKTGETIQLPESNTVRFKPSAALRDRVNR